MSEMGDDLRINILDEAVNNQQKVLYSGTLKISLLYALLSFTLSRRL